MVLEVFCCQRDNHLRTAYILRRPRRSIEISLRIWCEASSGDSHLNARRSSRNKRGAQRRHSRNEGERSYKQRKDRSGRSSAVIARREHNVIPPARSSVHDSDNPRRRVHQKCPGKALCCRDDGRCRTIIGGWSVGSDGTTAANRNNLSFRIDTKHRRCIWYNFDVDQRLAPQSSPINRFDFRESPALKGLDL